MFLFYFVFSSLIRTFAPEISYLIRIKIYGNSNQSHPDALRRDGTAF